MDVIRCDGDTLLIGIPAAITDDERRRAARRVASAATDAGDLRDLLDMLGLSAVEGTQT